MPPDRMEQLRDSTQRALLKKAAEFGGGFAAYPHVRHVQVRAREVINLGKRDEQRPQIRIPQLPDFSLHGITKPIGPVVDLPEAVEFLPDERYYSAWITTEVEVDSSDVFHPVILLKGYQRIYRFQVWMRAEDYAQRYDLPGWAHEEEQEEQENDSHE